MVIHHKPALGLFLMMLLVSSILFEESTPLIPIGIGSFHIQDIILLMLLGSIILRKATGKSDFITTPVDLPLLAFYSVAILASVVALKVNGLDARQMIRVLRSVTYYLSFFIVTNMITDLRQLSSLVNYFLATAAITAVTMIGQTVIGDSVLLTTGRVEQARTLEGASDALRILPPGETVLFCSFLVTLCMSGVRSASGRICTGLTMLYGAGILITYNRSFWVAILVVFMLGVFLLPKHYYKRIIVSTLISGCIVAALILTLSSTSTVIRESYASMSFRLLSLFDNTELIESRSLEDRFIENSYAIEKIKQNPALGIGLGNSYRPSLFGPDDELTSYIHNAYLWIVLNTGGIGLLFFVCFFTRCSLRGWTKCSEIADGKWMMILAGLTLSTIGMAFIAFVNPIFMQGHSILVVAIVAGIIETAIRLNAETEPRNEK